MLLIFAHLPYQHSVLLSGKSCTCCESCCSAASAETSRANQAATGLTTEVQELKATVASLRAELTTQQSQVLAAQRDSEAAVDEVSKLKRALQETKDASDRYSRRLVEVTAELDTEVCVCVFVCVRACVRTHVLV